MGQLGITSYIRVYGASLQRVKDPDSLSPRIAEKYRTLEMMRLEEEQRMRLQPRKNNKVALQRIMFKSKPKVYRK